MSEYSAERRTKRTHQRAVKQGIERFDAKPEDLALDPGTPDREIDDDDETVAVLDDDAPESTLGQTDALSEELPPHWGEFNQHD